MLVGLVGAAAALAPSQLRRSPVAPSTVVTVSGAPIAKQTESGVKERWWKSKVAVTFDASLDELGPDARQAAETAFGTWLASDAELPALEFRVGTDARASLEPDGINSVSFGEIDIPGKKQALAVTIGHVDPSSGQIVEADIVVNSKKPFAVIHPDHGADEDEDEHGCGGKYDLQNALTHEVGHFFGLDEDETDADGTMFFKTGKCELKKRDLTTSDWSVMSSLYAGEPPAAEDTGGGCGGANVAAAPPAKWGLASVIVALGLAGRFRRRRAPRPRRTR